jgi:hypothetical protein
MTTEERIAAIRADLNGASGVSRNGERIRSAHAHLDAIQARLRSLTEAAQVAADSLEWQKKITADLNDEGMHIESEFLYTALSLLSKEGITPGGG